MQRSEGTGRPGARGGPGQGRRTRPGVQLARPAEAPASWRFSRRRAGSARPAHVGRGRLLEGTGTRSLHRGSYHHPRSRVRHKRSHIQERAQAPAAAHLHPYLMPR